MGRRTDLGDISFAMKNLAERYDGLHVVGGPEGIDKYLAHSCKLKVDDLNWAEARQVGLSEEEQFVLTYFADIEGQTIFYLRDLLNTRAAENPEVTAFLTMWNYEEFFHGWTLTKLLGVCGIPLSPGRIAEVRRSSSAKERLLAFGGKLAARILPDDFTALYMVWGAINELTTLRGYEAVERRTRNPVLKEISARIAKQERRHFAWYFNSARERLVSGGKRQRRVRWGLVNFWTPVGQGVKPEGEFRRVAASLFSDPEGPEILKRIDETIATLPGLEGLNLMERYLFL